MGNVREEVMSLGSYGRFFRVVRFVSRPFHKIKAIPALDELPAPAVYVCRHKNMQGPILTLLWLPRYVRPWIYNAFCEREACFHQFYDYTLTERLHWWKPAARLVGWTLSRLIPLTTRSLHAIPVYRKSAKAFVTMRQTARALAAGDSVILYPDVDYTDTSDKLGQLYRGYLLLGMLYHKLTGENLRFVPLRVDEDGIRATEPIVYDGQAPLEAEISRVEEAIRRQLA